MVYRGRSGAGPEKKGEDVFPSAFVFCSETPRPAPKHNGPKETGATVFGPQFPSGHGHMPWAIAPQMCFGWSPAHRCARCTLSRSSVVISAWRCGALIQRNSGDNHGQSPLVHLEGPLRGPLGSSGPQPGLRADPGGVKNYPPRVTVGI